MDRTPKRSGKRMTKRDGQITVLIDHGFSAIDAAVNRLADYEDTGLAPEEVGRMKEYMQPFTIQDMDRFREIMQAEKEGRLVVLPCGLGGTVYVNFKVRGDYLREKDKPYPCKVVFIGLSDKPYLHIEFKTGRVWPVNLDAIGKTVFQTKEAAEAALKEKEG